MVEMIAEVDGEAYLVTEKQTEIISGTIYLDSPMSHVYLLHLPDLNLIPKCINRQLVKHSPSRKSSSSSSSGYLMMVEFWLWDFGWGYSSQSAR